MSEALKQLVKAAGQKKTSISALEELCGALTRGFSRHNGKSGAESVADYVHNLLGDAKCKPEVKARLLDTFFRLETVRLKASDPTNIDDMSDEEIESELEDLLSDRPAANAD